MEFHDRRQPKKPFREWLLNLCGYEIWPPTYSNPFIKGPQPRIITKRQREAMEKMRSAHDKMKDGGSSNGIV